MPKDPPRRRSIPAISAMSAMIKSRMPQKTKFAYTRSPAEVTHQPVPVNARSALNASRPATTNIRTAAKVTIPGLLCVAALLLTGPSVGPPIPPETGSLCWSAIISPFSCVAPWGLRRVYGPLHLLGVCSNLLLHLLLGVLDRLIHTPLDRLISNHDQGRLALLEHLPYL